MAAVSLFWDTNMATVTTKAVVFTTPVENFALLTHGLIMLPDVKI